MGLRGTPITYEEELKKNPDLKESDVQMLREWCAKQPHLPKISDVQLAIFLGTNHHSVETTKSKIDMYFTMRTHLPEFFSNRDPRSKELRAAYTTSPFVYLEQLTHDGHNIIYNTMMNLSDYDYNATVKYVNMVHDLWTHTHGTSLGSVLIVNEEGMSLTAVMRISPMGLKKFLLYIQEALPIQLKRVYFMNSSPIMDMLTRMMKPFMKKELIELTDFHATLESVTKSIPLDALPNELGGKAGNVKDLAADGVKLLENNAAWFQIEEATMRVNESLRPGKAKISTDLFGVEGSFKKLALD